MSKKIKFTLAIVEKQYEQPLCPDETPKTFIEYLLERWDIKHFDDIKMKVNGDMIENAVQNTIVKINESSQVRVGIYGGKIRVTIDQDMIAFESDVNIQFGQLSQHIHDEIFSLSERVPIKLRHEGVELKDTDCVIDIHHNPKITVVLMTKVNFRGKKTLSMNVDLNAYVRIIIETLQQQFAPQTIIALRYKTNMIQPMYKLRNYIAMPDETVDVEFDDDKPRTIQLTVQYENDSRDFQIQLLSKMEEFVQQLRRSFSDIQNSKIKLHQSNAELSQQGNLRDVIKNYFDVIILERIGGDEKIDIFLVKKGKNGPKQRKQIITNDKISTLNQYFPKLTINYYYQGKLLIREKSFFAQKIRQTQSIIEFEEIQGEFKQYTFIDAYTEATKVITLNSNEILHNQICKLLGEETDEYWACVDCKSVSDTKKALSTYELEEGFISYGLKTMYLKVKYQGDIQNIKVYKEDNVIDLYIIFREEFKISIDQDFEITYDNYKIDDIYLYKLWAKADGVYEIILLDQKQPIIPQPELKNQKKLTIFVTHLNKSVEFEASTSDTITNFIKKLLIFLSLPINQPCDLIVDGTRFSIKSEGQLSENPGSIKLSISDQIMIHLKERDADEELYPDKPFESAFKDMIEEFDLKNCEFYHHGKQIDVSKTFKELNIFYEDEIEFERKQEAKNQIIRIPEEETMTPEGQLNSKIVSQNQQNFSNLHAIQTEQLSSNKTASFPSQNQVSNSQVNAEQQVVISQIHTETPVMQQAPELFRQSQNTQSSVPKESFEAQTSQKITSSMLPFTELTQPIQQVEKKTIALRIGGKEVEMDIEINLTVGQLKKLIIEEHNQSDDIVLKQDGGILKDDEKITNYEQIFLVVPNVIKIITISKTKEYEFSFKPNAKLQELFIKMQQYYKQNFQLIFNKVQLKPEQTFKEAGLKNLSKVQMKY